MTTTLLTVFGTRWSFADAGIQPHAFKATDAHGSSHLTSQTAAQSHPCTTAKEPDALQLAGVGFLIFIIILRCWFNWKACHGQFWKMVWKTYWHSLILIPILVGLALIVGLLSGNFRQFIVTLIIGSVTWFFGAWVYAFMATLIVWPIRKLIKSPINASSSPRIPENTDVSPALRASENDTGNTEITPPDTSSHQKLVEIAQVMDERASKLLRGDDKAR